MGKRVKNALRGAGAHLRCRGDRGASGRRAGDRCRGAPSQPPPPPAPLGVFGDSLPGAGNLLLTLSPQFVGNAHSLVGTQGLSPQQIVATTPWYWNPRSRCAWFQFDDWTSCNQ